MVKKRIEEKSNYSAVFVNGKTFRFAIDSTNPIKELEYPEFYDVKITNFCTGNCPYCYQCSEKESDHYSINDFRNYFKQMTPNQRPFQIAIGGGNPNQHPYFINFLTSCKELGICPNYTTNGIGIDKDITWLTKELCGGVAVTCHEHLEQHWLNAVFEFARYNNRINLHILISDVESVGYFISILKLKDIIDYFVLLPMMPLGRSLKGLDNEARTMLFNYIDNMNDKDRNQIAYGANFYNDVKKRNYGLSLYEPEIFSKYLDLKNMKLYPSSFSV